MQNQISGLPPASSATVSSIYASSQPGLILSPASDDPLSRSETWCNVCRLVSSWRCVTCWIFAQHIALLNQLSYPYITHSTYQLLIKLALRPKVSCIFNLVGILFSMLTWPFAPQTVSLGICWRIRG